MHSARTLGLAILIASAVFLGYALMWRSFDAFAASIDHEPRLFVDFERFWYPAARAIAAGRPPPSDFLYSPAFAVLLRPIAALDLEAARLAWAGIIVASQVAFLVWPAVVFGRRSHGAALIWVAAFLTSAALLHDFKWGQVSTLSMLLIWASFRLADERPVVAGIVLGLAVAIKLYPIMAVAWFLCSGRWRASIAALAASLVLAVAVPIAILGAEPAWSAFSGALAHRATLINDPNSQYVAHAAHRWAVHFGLRGDVVAPARTIGWIVTALVLWRTCVIARSRPHDSVLGFGLLASAIPFWVPTSWPHYFVYLPLAQVVALRRSRWLALAFLPSSIAGQLALGGYPRFGASGVLLVTQGVVLAALLTTRGRPDPHA